VRYKGRNGVFSSSQKENRRHGRNMAEEWTEPKYLDRLMLTEYTAESTNGWGESYVKSDISDA
jgi:hypothetical protein